MRKNILRAHKLLTAESLADDFESDPVTLTTATRIAFNIKAYDVSDNSGTFSVEHRLYRDADNYSDWASLTLDASPVLADDDVTLLVDVDVPPGQVRLVFTADGGTPDGSADVWITGAQGG